MDWRLFFQVDGKDAFAYIEYLEGAEWFRGEILGSGLEFHSASLESVLEWIKAEYREFCK